MAKSDQPFAGQFHNMHVVMRTIWLSIAGNALLAIIKGLAGFFGNSYALIADAIESLTDIFASVLVLFGLRYSRKPPDAEHPYGHGKIEPLVTFIVVGFMILAAGLIVHDSIQNILTPHELPEPWTLAVLGVILIWKELAYRFISKKSRQSHSTSLRGEAWHQRSDAITSAAAFIGISIAVLFGKGFETADDWAAMIAAVIILYNCYLIFRPALGEIMDEQVHDELIEKIREVSSDVEGILDTEKCYVRKSGMKYHVDLHAHVDGKISVREGHRLAHKLKDVLKKELPRLGEILIHIEPEE
jgi:cation diffusion facilitator family transporter